MNNINTNRKALVTGGAGFIGSNLCKRLLDSEYDVICLDNLYSGDLNNVKPLMHNNRFRFIERDIRDVSIVNDYMFDGVTEIYNCACPASPIYYQGKHAIDTTMTCVVGMKNMLDLANRLNAKIMQFSTSEVYGEPDCEYQSEGYRGSVNCTGIRACYDEGKRCAESLCFDYNRLYGTRIKVIRIFNTYGPNMRKDDGRVISNFICQALEGSPITIFGDGSQTRSFCYIDDLIDGILLVMNTADSLAGPINLGNPIEKSVYDIAKLINSQVSSLLQIPDNPNIVFKQLPHDDPTHRKPDIKKARFFGFDPKISLEEGILNTIKYFKSLK